MKMTSENLQKQEDDTISEILKSGITDGDERVAVISKVSEGVSRFSHLPEGRSVNMPMQDVRVMYAVLINQHRMIVLNGFALSGAGRPRHELIQQSVDFLLERIKIVNEHYIKKYANLSNEDRVDLSIIVFRAMVATMRSQNDFICDEEKQLLSIRPREAYPWMTKWQGSPMVFG
jgi:hypothetical protein